jgi:hypothetical protein
VAPGMRLRLAPTLLALSCVLATSRVGAEEPSVPVSLEAELLAKVAAYDKHMAARAGDRVHVVILVKQGNPDSERASAQMANAIGAIGQIGGRAHDELLVSYTGAGALAEVCRTKHAAIVFVTPGFADDIGAIAGALDGVDVLSASAIAEYVAKGVVLGFDLVSGRPKLLVNLTQAKKQKVDLAAEILKLMKVYE